MKYEYWLADLNGIPLGKKILLRKCVKAAEELYYMEETQMRKFEFLDEGERNTIQQARKQGDPGAKYDAMVKKGDQVCAVVFG